MKLIESIYSCMEYLRENGYVGYSEWKTLNYKRVS